MWKMGGCGYFEGIGGVWNDFEGRGKGKRGILCVTTPLEIRYKQGKQFQMFNVRVD